MKKITLFCTAEQAKVLLAVVMEYVSDFMVEDALERTELAPPVVVSGLVPRARKKRRSPRMSEDVLEGNTGLRAVLLAGSAVTSSSGEPTDFRLSAVEVACEQLGLLPSSASGALSRAKSQGYVQRGAHHGLHRLTSLGMSTANRYSSILVERKKDEPAK